MASKNGSTLTVEELKKALATLQEAVDFAQQSTADESRFKIARDACIQRFEYCIELAWKTSMKLLGSVTKAPKPAIREMARNNIIPSAELWLEFIEARNNTSHSYDEDIAQSVYAQIQIFLPAAHKLVQQLESLA